MISFFGQKKAVTPTDQNYSWTVPIHIPFGVTRPPLGAVLAAAAWCKVWEFNAQGWLGSGGFLSHTATPSHHPFIDGISSTNHPAIEGTPHWNQLIYLLGIYAYMYTCMQLCTRKCSETHTHTHTDFTHTNILSVYICVHMATCAFFPYNNRKATDMSRLCFWVTELDDGNIPQ